MNILPQVEDIVAQKRSRLAERKARIPMTALRALAGMQRRSEPVLTTITDTVMIIGQICHTPRGYDPVKTAIDFWQAGVDAVAMFTDDEVYEGSSNDLTLISLAIPIPTINLNYVFDEYQVVETRTAGASALTLYPGLLDKAALRELTSSTQRNRMTAIIDVGNADELHEVLDFCPPAIAMGKRSASGELDVRSIEYLRSFVPACSRIVLSTPLRSLEEARIAARMHVNAIYIEPNLTHSVDALREIFA